MAFRDIVIRHKSKLLKHYGFLDIQLRDHQYKIPFSDINTLILDTLHCSITTAALSTLTRNNVSILISDSHHLPRSIVLPYNQYFSRLTVLDSQIKVPNRIKGRLWQKIIKRKILNEIYVMKALNRPVNDMNIIRRNVNLYDKRHCESIAARIYFERIFGKCFGRRNSSIINSSLNYGYSLIFSCLARSICSMGLEPALGLWHHSKQNSFNLADDLIEPFRSIVDLFVIDILKHNRITSKSALTMGDKLRLLHILVTKVMCNKKQESITRAVWIEVNSYKKCLLNCSTRIILPEFCK